MVCKLFRAKDCYNVLNMNPYLLATKFHIPPLRSDGITRPRLLDRMTAGLRENRKLTLVSAPAGYGKTTLVAEWLHFFSSGQRVVWLSLEEADNDPVRYLLYWIETLRSVDQSLGQSAQSLLSVPQISSTTIILDELLNELAALETRVCLVMDDYHVITNPQIHQTLEYFIDHQPAGTHLILTTRADPPLPLARLRASGQMTEIRARDLRFTPAEAHQFFDRSLDISLADSTLRALDERTEGWAVGLQLAALALQYQPDPAAFIETFRGSHRYVLDYLAEEVVRQQDEETRAFLIRTSILDRFNAELCEALIGRADSRDVIARLEAANLFIIPLDDERRWYRYHHLFADYLQTGLSKSEQSLLQEKASQWFEENDLVFEAVKHAFFSENLERTADVIERVIQKPSAWSGGEITTLVGWLDALPGQLLQSKPALCLHASRAWYIAGRINLSEKYLGLAEQSLKESSTSNLHNKTLLAISAERRAALAVLRGDLSFAIERATYALNQLPEEDLYDRARAGAMLGLAYGLKGDLEKASHLFIKASDLAHNAGVSFMVVMARCEAALMQITQGRLNLATQTVQHAIQLAGEKVIPPFGFAWYVLAEIAWERNELSSSEKYLMDGIELSRQGVLIDDLRFQLMMLAHLKKSTGDLAAAMTAIEQAHSICQSFELPRFITLSSAHRARIQLANGMLDSAHQWAQQYQEFRNSHQVEYTQEYEDLTLARVFLANGKHDQALEILTSLFEKADATGRIRTCIEATILLSLTSLAQNKTTSALEWLVKALKLAEPDGFLRLFLDEGALIAELLPKVRNTSPRFVDQILQVFSNQTQDTGQKELQPTINDLIHPLSEQELRVLNFIVAGKSNQQIADELVISRGTAKWHVHNILQKLGVGNRPQAIARARELGIS
jgi:LuxR family maltose regulon positive regulatory protein